MNTFVTALALILIVSVIVTLVLVILRPGLLDRIIGIGVIGTKTTVLLAYIGVLFERPGAFVDIALTYALLNFVVALTVARYFTWPEAMK